MSLADQKTSIEYIQNEAAIWIALEQTAALCLSDESMIADVACEYSEVEMNATFEALNLVEVL